jgi:hypothetical protein
MTLAQQLCDLVYLSGNRTNQCLARLAERLLACYMILIVRKYIMLAKLT